MFASILRSAMFISLLLIVSVTLSGCSIDFGAIFNGIKTFIGNLSGNLGSFIKKGVGVVKDVISKVKEVAEPIADIAKNVFNNTSVTADKVMDTLNKADATADRVGEVGGTLRDVGNKLNTTDAVGNNTGNAPTAAAVAPRDTEETTNNAGGAAAVNQGNPFTNWLNSLVSRDRKQNEAKAVNNITTTINNGNTAQNTLTLPSAVSQNEVETLSAEEKEVIKENIKKEAAFIKANIEQLNKEISSLSGAAYDDVKKSKANVDKISRKIDEIINDPLNEKSVNRVDEVSVEIKEVLDIAEKYGNQAGGLADALKDAFEACETGYESISNDFEKVFKDLF
ncbi:MAG: hypothetical protein PHF08_08430 [Candidatus Riflebacteria bacterium]|nr:hypothetical protein [Candidatus Riflebacteria bacterium]